MAEMREVPIFIASSVREFEQERKEISVFLDMLNEVHQRDGVRLRWYRPETMSRALVRGGSQRPYDEKIRECRFFVLLIGKDLGQHTAEEFRLAWELYREQGRPVIIPYFLNVRASVDVLNFQKELRKELYGDGQTEEMYVDTYDSLDQILQYLHIELIRYGAFRTDAPPSDREEAAQRGQAAARELIQEQREKIAELEQRKAQSVTPQLVAELTDAYEELTRLVQTYRLEPDALLDYMDFLWKQHLYDRGIAIGHWLEGFYQMEDPGEKTWARLKNRLGVNYKNSNQYKKAEKYYREALEIRQRLADKDSLTYEADVAASCDNLAILLKNTCRMGEAEELHRKALEIYRRLAAGNPAAYEPDVATTCNNLAILLKNTNRMEEAERYYREALEIRRRLAEGNPAAYEPYVAMTCNNLGNLLKDTNRMEEAEGYYREALEIYKRLAEGNPGAYEPYVAGTCFNLGLFERKQGNFDAARRYFQEAQTLYEKFPHCAKDTQDCRNALELIDALAALPS